jgi:hypothetical protein
VVNNLVVDGNMKGNKNMNQTDAAIEDGQIMCPVPPEDFGGVKLATRIGSLAGIQVGFLGNLKPNCDVLLHTTEEEVLKLGATSTMFREKASCSLGAGAKILDEIAANCKAAVVALGD